jgi:hypothetical protein
MVISQPVSQSDLSDAGEVRQSGACPRTSSAGENSDAVDELLLLELSQSRRKETSNKATHHVTA